MFPHQLYVGELLGHGEGVVADGQHVPLDGLGLGLQHSQPVGGRGVDLHQRLLVLTQRGQLPDQGLRHLLHRLPVELEDGRAGEGGVERGGEERR